MRRRFVRKHSKFGKESEAFTYQASEGRNNVSELNGAVSVEADDGLRTEVSMLDSRERKNT